MPHPFSVLVVEDDATLRATVAREITEAGHRVRSAATTRAAIAELAESPADILVSDVILPDGPDGVALCRLVKETRPETEVILLSGHASVTNAIEGVRLGACDFLLKPLEPGAVARSVATAAARVAHRLAEREVVTGLRARADGQSALLDLLAVPILIADGDARVHGRNAAAAPLLADSGPLALGRDGRIRASPETRALRDTLAAVCGPIPPEPTAVTLPPRAGALRLRAVVAPLSAGVSGLRPGPLAAVLVDLPERSAVAPNAEMLSLLYGLTPAEGELAARLVAGDSVQEASDALGIAVATARTHLSRVFSKTGARRQGDLVGLVLSGPALLAGLTPGTAR
jgi:FixJ family two-component response regulator